MEPPQRMIGLIERANNWICASRVLHCNENYARIGRRLSPGTQAQRPQAEIRRRGPQCVRDAAGQGRDRRRHRRLGRSLSASDLAGREMAPGKSDRAGLRRRRSARHCRADENADLPRPRRRPRRSGHVRAVRGRYCAVGHSRQGEEPADLQTARRRPLREAPGLRQPSQIRRHGCRRAHVRGSARPRLSRPQSA